MMMNENARESCQRAPAVVSCSGSSTPAPRFSLQKRKVSSVEQPAPLTSVNSDFLCGLFADVAEAQSADAPEKDSPNSESPRPVKRSRVSFSRSMVRNATTLNLCDQSSSSSSTMFPAPSVLDLIDQALSPTSTTEIIKVQGGCAPLPQDLSKPSRGTAASPSLKIRDNTSSQSTEDSAGPVFPHLPATISATSCNTLTRNLSDLQSSLAENSEKESYGWFVEMDDEYVREAAVPAYEPAQTNDLTFQAPTAPKAGNYDAELEWAKAADTVDDVLGDFF